MEDMSHLSMDELLDWRAKCRRLSKLYDADRLNFVFHGPYDETCSVCNKRGDLVEVDRQHFCRQCFVCRYYNLPVHFKRGVGNPWPSQPLSQRQYHDGLPRRRDDF